MRRYVLVTPARNEEATIENTIRSVVEQTLHPEEWVIVSDGSTDNTESIVQQYSARYPFIRLLPRKPDTSRSFASVVFAIQAGIAHIQTRQFDYIGLLDADVRFRAEYFATLIQRFESNANLGLAGGLVLDVGTRTQQHQYLKDVAGATQFFRRECFRALGSLIAIPEGGWDAITNLQVRANGYDTQTFSDIIVDHLKPRNSAVGGVWQRNFQFGVRDYALGGDPWFEFAKCIFRWRETPLIMASLLRLTGFTWATLSRRPRVISPEVVRAVRCEQRKRLWRGIAVNMQMQQGGSA